MKVMAHPSGRVEAILTATPLDVPLVVDLDETLTPTDTFAEGLLRLSLTRPWHAIGALGHVVRGNRAAAKARVASFGEFHAALLPYRTGLMQLLRAEREKGRRVILATAADGVQAQAVAEHLGLFDGIWASDGKVNLKGGTKLERLQAELSSTGFIYVGDAHADLPIFAAAKVAIVVEPGIGFQKVASRRGIRFVALRDEPADGRGTFLVESARQLRVWQWAKNLLVILPAISSLGLYPPAEAPRIVLAALAMCFVASFVYIVNDVIDLWVDRAHAKKRNRPLASGRFSVLMALGWSLACLVAASLAMSGLNRSTNGLIGLYIAVSLLYSRWIRSLLIYDIIALAFLYILRVIIGNNVIGVSDSYWFYSFLYFLLLHLALWKRFVEYRTVASTDTARPVGRGYSAGDLDLLRSAGMAMVAAAGVVLVIYTTSSDVARIYHHAGWLLALFPLQLAHALRLWFKVDRQAVSHDPVLEIIRSADSWVIAALSVAVIVLARN